MSMFFVCLFWRRESVGKLGARVLVFQKKLVGGIKLMMLISRKNLLLKVRSRNIVKKFRANKD